MVIHAVLRYERSMQLTSSLMCQRAPFVPDTNDAIVEFENGAISIEVYTVRDDNCRPVCGCRCWATADFLPNLVT